MLRYKEKVDIEARLAEVEDTVSRWRKRVAKISERLRNEFLGRLHISLIYHDAALEGDVLTYSEIKAAVDPTIISDSSLIPSYEAIKRYDNACKRAKELSSPKKKALKLDTIKELYMLLAPEDGDKGAPYRKENPLHRLYYHDIAPPEKISYRMRKFSQWLDDPSTRTLHPLDRVAQTHHQLMSIFPWSKETGRCARIVSNLLLRRAKYPIAVIHSTDRQRYYEALRNDAEALMLVYLEAVETAALSEMQVYDEAARVPRRRHA